MTTLTKRDVGFMALGFVLGAAIVGTLVARLGVGSDKRSGVPPIGDGSDPIVVDNSNLRIYRNLHTPRSIQGRTDWRLGPSNAFDWLVGTAIYKKGNQRISHKFGYELEGVDVVRFFVKGDKAFELRLDKAEGAAYAQPYSAHEFDTESAQQAGLTITKLKRKGNPNVTHVTAVEFGNRKLCLGTGGKPDIVAFNAPCISDDSPPWELHLSVEPMLQ